MMTGQVLNPDVLPKYVQLNHQKCVHIRQKHTFLLQVWKSIKEKSQKQNYNRESQGFSQHIHFLPQLKQLRLLFRSQLITNKYVGVFLAYFFFWFVFWPGPL